MSPILGSTIRRTFGASNMTRLRRYLADIGLVAASDYIIIDFFY